MHCAAVINAGNANMLHGVLFTVIAVMMGDSLGISAKCIPEPVRNWGRLKRPQNIPAEEEEAGRASTKQDLSLVYPGTVCISVPIMAKLPVHLVADDSLVANVHKILSVLYSYQH